MRGMIGLFLLLTGISVQAEESAGHKAFSEAFKRTVLPYVKSLTHDVVTFHYSQGTKVPSRSLDDFIGGTKGQPEFFFKESYTENSMVGPGYYVAIDPSSSRSFGGADPQLSVLTLTRGMRYLDLADPALKKELMPLVSLAKASPCLNGSMHKSFETLFGKWRNSPKLDCRRELIQWVNDIGIEAVLYKFEAASLESCSPRRAEAFNLIRSSAVDWSGVALYTDRERLEAVRSPPAAMIGAAYHEGLNTFALRYSASLISTSNVHAMGLLPRKLEAEVVSPESYIEFKQNYLWHCKAADSSDIVERWARSYDESLRLNYKDSGYQNLLIEARVAFAVKANDYMKRDPDLKLGSPFFELLSLREFQNRMLKALGGLTPSQFRKVLSEVQTLTYSSASLSPEVGEILGEATPDWVAKDSWGKAEFMQNHLDQLQSRAGERRLGQLPVLMKAIGFGPRLSFVYFNALSEGSGLVPLMTSRIPLSSTADETSLFEQNLALASALLRDCIAQYRDPRWPLEKIQEGRCAIVQVEAEL